MLSNGAVKGFENLEEVCLVWLREDRKKEMKKEREYFK